MDLDNTCFSVFTNRGIDPVDLLSYRQRLANYQTYLIAMTPRSGSSLLADLLRATGTAGRPAEYLAHRQMAGTLAALEKRGRRLENPIQYLNWVLEARTTPNRVLGLKASYFQYRPIIDTGLETALFGVPRLIYLTRNNIVLQAISMFIATSTRLFHAVQDDSAAAGTRADPPYSVKDIRKWVAHIHAQERGWERYFASAGRPVFKLDYDGLKTDAAGQLARVLGTLGLQYEAKPGSASSGHKKIGGALNAAFFDRFIADSSNRRFLEDQEVAQDRWTGA